MALMINKHISTLQNKHDVNDIVILTIVELCSNAIRIFSFKTY